MSPHKPATDHETFSGFIPSTIIRLDSANWLLALDPTNQGR